MSKEIIITLDEIGRPTVEANGYVGGECISATQPYLDALGAKDVDVEEKPEIHQGGGKAKEQIRRKN